MVSLKRLPMIIYRKCQDEGNAQKLEKLKLEYQNILERLDVLEQQQIIGAFDKRTIIELTRDVIKEISQKYEHVQKGVGDIMGGALIETEARRLRDEAAAKATREAAIKMALKLLQMGKLTIEEIAVCTGLTVIEIENLKNMQLA